MNHLEAIKRDETTIIKWYEEVTDIVNHIPKTGSLETFLEEKLRYKNWMKHT